jgi:hypothetical protein
LVEKPGRSVESVPKPSGSDTLTGWIAGGAVTVKVVGAFELVECDDILEVLGEEPDERGVTLSDDTVAVDTDEAEILLMTSEVGASTALC